MRRALFAGGALLLGLTILPSTARAEGFYEARREFKELGKQANGLWLKEDHLGISKLNIETGERSSIFLMDTWKWRDIYYSDEDYTQEVGESSKEYGWVSSGRDSYLADGNDIYTIGNIYGESGNTSLTLHWDIESGTLRMVDNGLGDDIRNFFRAGVGEAGGNVNTDFTDLTINGVSVQGQIDDNKTAINNNKNAIRKNKKAIDTNRTNINNLGDGIAASTALGAALSALPVTPDDAPFSCGVGSGAYSSRFAMGLGCVAKLNHRLSLNAGGSHVFGGSSNYGGGSLDSVAWRGGFVLKLGKLDSPAATNEQLQSQLNEVKQENASIKEENAVIKAKYTTIEEQNKALMARLERLEAIALGQKPASTTASLK